LLAARAFRFLTSIGPPTDVLLLLLTVTLCSPVQVACKAEEILLCCAFSHASVDAAHPVHDISVCSPQTDGEPDRAFKTRVKCCLQWHAFSEQFLLGTLTADASRMPSALMACARQFSQSVAYRNLIATLSKVRRHFACQPGEFSLLHVGVYVRACVCECVRVCTGVRPISRPGYS